MLTVVASGAYHFLYNTSKWKKLRAAQLREEPLCRICKNAKEVKQADTVDHIKPHKGDKELFFDSTNLQSLCKECHDSIKKEIEIKGYYSGCDENGWPLSKNHPVYRGKM